MGLISALFVNFVFSIGITSAQHYYCGLEEYHATSFAHTLRSPRNNGDQETYPPNARCAWTITVETGKLVQLNFTFFDTYGNPTCDGPNDDFLEIYDAHYDASGWMIGKYCGSSLPANVVSTHNNLYLVFKTTNRQVVNKKGFILQYKRIDDPDDDESVCSPLNSLRTNTYIHLKASSVTRFIKSPLYPNKYPSNIECLWVLTAPESKTIKLIVKNVKIFNYKTPISCSSAGDDVDFLTVHDGSSYDDPKMKSFCKSSSSSTTLTSSDMYMTIRFKSNLDNYFIGNTAGFEIEYTEYSSNVEEIVGIIIAVISIIVLIWICYCCIKKPRRYQGYEQRVPEPTMQMTTTTTSAPQDPVQPQGGYEPLPQAGQAHYPPKGEGSNPPPVQSSYLPPSQGSYPPPSQGSYPPPTQGSYPPTIQSSTQPPTQGSYPPPSQGSYQLNQGHPPTTQGSYPPPSQGNCNNPPTTQGSSQIPGQGGYSPTSQAGGQPQTAPYPVPNDPPPQYPGPPAYPPQANQPYNPQGGPQQPPYPPPVDNKASAPPPL